MANDEIMDSWLEAQVNDARQLNERSDVVSVLPLDRQKYVVSFSCRGVVRSAAGEITQCDHFAVGIRFPEDYLRRFNPADTIYLMSPAGTFHPNVYQSAICVGNMVPGAGLVSLITQIHSILSYQHMNLNDPLSSEAAVWAREHLDLFPVDRRPLLRGRMSVGEEQT